MREIIVFFVGVDVQGFVRRRAIDSRTTRALTDADTAAGQATRCRVASIDIPFLYPADRPSVDILLY